MRKILIIDEEHYSRTLENYFRDFCDLDVSVFTGDRSKLCKLLESEKPDIVISGGLNGKWEDVYDDVARNRVPIFVLNATEGNDIDNARERGFEVVFPEGTRDEEFELRDKAYVKYSRYVRKFTDYILELVDTIK